MFHKKVQKEAEAVVRALPTMICVEHGITPENFFIERGIDPTEGWMVKTRCLTNHVTSATKLMLAETEDLHMEEE